MPKPSLQATFGNNSQGGDNLPQGEFVSVRRELMQQLMTSEPQMPMRGMEPSYGMEMEHRHSHPSGGLPMNFQRQGHPPAPLSHRDSLTMGRMQHMSNMNMEPMNHRGSMYHTSQFGRGMPGGGSQNQYLASPQTPSRMASIAQQNQEDELLARLLMARRQRLQQQQQQQQQQHHQQQHQQQQQQQPQQSHHHHRPMGVDQAMTNDTHVLADDLLRLRQAREADAMLLAPPESPFAMRSPSMQMGPGVMGSPMDTSGMSRSSRHSMGHRPSPMTESHLLRPSNLTSNTPGVLSQEIDDYLRKQEMRLRSPERVDRLPNRFPNMRAHELAQHQMEMMMGAGRQAFDHLKIPSIEPTGLESAKRKRVHKKKPADMPRRPLSAYNLFFSEERERILREIDPEQAEAAAAAAAADLAVASPISDEKSVLPAALLRPLVSSEKKRRPHRKTHGKIGFKLLAQMVGQRWKTLPDERRKYYQDLAEEDLKRHKTAMEDYYKKQSKDGDEKPSGDAVVNMDQEGDDLDVAVDDNNSDVKSPPPDEPMSSKTNVSVTSETN